MSKKLLKAASAGRWELSRGREIRNAPFTNFERSRRRFIDTRKSNIINKNCPRRIADNLFASGLVGTQGAGYKSVASVCNLFISTWLARSQSTFCAAVEQRPFVSRGTLRFALTAAGSVRAMTGKRIDANSITRVSMRANEQFSKFASQLVVHKRLYAVIALTKIMFRFHYHKWKLNKIWFHLFISSLNFC